MPPPRMRRVASPFELVTPATPAARRPASPQPVRNRSTRARSRNTSQLAHRHRRRHRRRTAFRAAASASRTAASPCTSRVTSRASSRCACRFSGSLRASPPRARRFARVEEREELQVPHRIAVVGIQPELIELVRLVSCGSSQIVPASVLPNFVPAAVVISGNTRPCALPPRTRRIRSMPAVMLPH